MITKIVPLKNITSIKQSGFVEVGFVEEIDDFYNVGFVIGSGSNLIVNKARKLFKLSERFNYIYYNDYSKVLAVGAATPIKSVISYCIKHNLSCLEFLAAVPASMGGAVFMNAGAFGKDMSNIIEYVKVFKDGLVLEIKPDKFDYRKSNIEGIIIEAGVRVYEEDKVVLLNRISSFVKRRLEIAHLRNTFGSVFKNPEHNKAGWLLEKSGLKGYSRNTVMFSNKHANYMVSKGNADVNDIMFLIDLAKTKVLKMFGIELEEEVVIL